MKKARSKNPSAPNANQTVKEYIHFHLCHVCLHLNEAPSEIVRCERCKRDLAIGSEWVIPGQELESPEQDSDDEAESVAPGARKRRLSLAGLSVIW